MALEVGSAPEDPINRLKKGNYFFLKWLECYTNALKACLLLLSSELSLSPASRRLKKEQESLNCDCCCCCRQISADNLHLSSYEDDPPPTNNSSIKHNNNNNNCITKTTNAEK